MTTATTKARYKHTDQGVGLRIGRRRTELRLSQREVAGDECTPAYLSHVEAGRRTPSRQLLEVFGRRLGVSAHWLATGEQDPVGLALDAARAVVAYANDHGYTPAGYPTKAGVQALVDLEIALARLAEVPR